MSTVSVVIPCYNAALWIRETLASVLAQSQPPLEIIVVDDGSTDGSGEIVATEFPQVRLLKGPNEGPSRARNIGAEAASGEWLQFLDGDDLLNPHKLAWQSPTLDHQPETVAFLYSAWQNFTHQPTGWHATGEIRSTSLHPDSYVQIFDHFTHISAGLIRKTWYEQVGGFDVHKPLIEDVHLQLRLLVVGATLAYLPTSEPVFYYRQVNQSLSRRNPARFVAECQSNLELAEAGLRDQGQLTLVRRDLLVRGYLFVARYYAEHDRARFEQVVDKMEELVPGFLPREPRSLAFTARVLGYRRAERVAVAYRQMKQRLRRVP